MTPSSGARTLGVVAAAVIATAALSGCRAKPAGNRPCATLDQVTCQAADRALVCAAPGAWAEVSCKGARGCARRGAVDECDDTIATIGDPCPRAPPLDYACSADRRQALACTEGRFALWRACRGPEGCQVADGRNVQCDTTLGAPGDPCAKRGTYACSEDRQSMLVCDGAALGPASSCRGGDGCKIERESNRVDCDDSAAAEGDACEEPRRIACSLDRKTELVCSEGKYVKKRECRRSDCRLEGAELFCD